MTDDARCPHCHLDLSDYGLELADHYFGDKWLCKSARETSVADYFLREAPHIRERRERWERVRNALQIFESLFLDEPGYEDLRPLAQRLRNALEALDPSRPPKGVV